MATFKGDDDSNYYRSAEQTGEDACKALRDDFVMKEFNEFTKKLRATDIDKKMIERHHIDKPAFSNVRDFRKKDAFLICKCYMPCKNSGKHSIKDVDFLTLITVICNFNPFRKKLQEACFELKKMTWAMKKKTKNVTYQELLEYEILIIQLLDEVGAVVESKNISSARENLREKIKAHVETRGYAVCSRGWNKKRALELLKIKIYPDMETLNALCQEDELKRKSEVTKDVCKEICLFIQTFSPYIIDVWASRKASAIKEGEIFDVKFVVVTDKTLNEEGRHDLEKRIKDIYDVLPLRDYDQFSPEEKELMKHWQIKLKDQDRDKLRMCVNKNANKLLQEHTYLNIISGCPFKSVRYGTKKQNIVETPCIVLNVQYKGYIPIYEEPFDLQYDGVQVDVREDVFLPYNQTAKERHTNLMAGCLISGEENRNGSCWQGTLSGFLDHPDYGLCGMSCAHCLLSPSQLHELAYKDHQKTAQIDWQCRGSDTLQRNVYQPRKTTEDNSNNQIGHLVKVIYQSGVADSQDIDAYGVEAALFHLSERLPNSSEFPEVKVSEAYAADQSGYCKIPVQFGTGSVEECSWHAGEVYSKYGAITGYTFGKPLQDNGLSVKTKLDYQHTEGLENDAFHFNLHNQVNFVKDKTAKHIIPHDCDKKSEDYFGYHGDSGALVYRQSKDGKLVCVGMIVGGTKSKKTIVTPILPILTKLGVSNFKNFDGERLENNTM